MNLPTFIVGAILAIIFAAIIVSSVKRRKNGGCSCGGGCGGCQMKGICHSNNENKN